MKYKVAVLSLIAIVSFALAPAVVQAQDSSPSIYADCGIGAAIFPEAKTGAIISNIIWDFGSTASSSALTTPSACAGKRAEAAAFIYKNYENVAEQTAQGEGEHLEALMNILDVNQLARRQVISDVRSEMAQRVNERSYLEANRVEKSERYYKNVMSAL